MATTVRCCRGLTYAGVTARGWVYVGRAVPRLGYPESDWANPYRVGRSAVGKALDLDHLTPERVVGRYRYYLMGRNALLARLYELRGKVLCCWCVDWPGEGEPDRPCHAVYLARLADVWEGTADGGRGRFEAFVEASDARIAAALAEADARAKGAAGP